MENLSQKIEKPPTTPQSRNKSPKQGLVEDIIGIKPMISDQPIIQTPSIPENRDPKEYEPILEKLMKEREKQAEEFLKKVPMPDHRGQYPYLQGVNQERNLDDQATSPKVFIKSPMREERVTPRERGDCGKPIVASPHTQVKTRYEVEMDGRRRIGSTEKKGQSTHRQTYPSQPPPPPPPTGGGAGGHRGGGGGDDGEPDDSDDGSDDDENKSEETDSETSSTQEVPQEELPEELRGQRVFCRRINGRGCRYS